MIRGTRPHPMMLLQTKRRQCISYVHKTIYTYTDYSAAAQIVPTPIQLLSSSSTTTASSPNYDSVVATDNSNVAASDNPPSVPAAASPTTVANDTQAAAPAAIVGNEMVENT